MSMHQGIDLSRFKKVSSDKKTSTLRHAKGHEIKIAHSALTPKMREQLQAMPMHLAKGGETTKDIDMDVGKEMFAAPPTDGHGASGSWTPEETPSILPEQSANNASPQELDSLQSKLQGPPPAQDAATLAPAAPPMASSEPAPEPAAPAPTQEAPQEAAPENPSPMPSQPAVQAPPPVDMELKQEDQHFSNDQAAGHIKPETMHDLFAKKDTLGKIGTIFGLLIGGAGAGLSGQPNALLGLMQKEIDNDFEAQKAEAGNKQNLYRLNLDHQMQTARIVQMKKEGLLTDAQIKAHNADATIKADTMTRMQMNRVALHKLIDQVNKLPLGSPQRMQAEQQLAGLSQSVQNENYSLADRAAAGVAMQKMIYGPGTEGGGSSEEALQSRTNWLRANGHEKDAEAIESHHLPGVKGQSSRPLSADDRDQALTGMQFKSQLGDFIKWTKDHSGDLSPTDRNVGQTMAKEIQSSYRASINGGVFKKGEQAFIDGIIDSDPTKFFNEIRVLPSLQTVKADTDKKLDQRMKSYGFKGIEKDKEEEPKERLKTVGGVTYKRGPNGEAIRVK